MTFSTKRMRISLRLYPALQKLNLYPRVMGANSISPGRHHNGREVQFLISIEIHPALTLRFAGLLTAIPSPHRSNPDRETAL
jgi:hypothetical protein